MSCVNKQAFLKPFGVKREKYPLPDYGPDAYVMLRSLTALDLRKLEDKRGPGPHDTDSNLAYTYDLLAIALEDDEGKAVFDSGDEVKSGLNLTVTAFKALLDRVLVLSGLNEPPKN